jgi:hypothetical protein
MHRTVGKDGFRRCQTADSILDLVSCLGLSRHSTLLSCWFVAVDSGLFSSSKLVSKRAWVGDSSRMVSSVARY